MTTLKLSQIVPAPSAPGGTDQFVAVRNGNPPVDMLFSTAQMESVFGGGGGGGGGSPTESQAVAAAVTPVVTVATGYGTNFVIGGILHFAGMFGVKGSGTLCFARVTCQQIEHAGMMLFLFRANPVASNFVDNAIAAIAPADVPNVLMPVSLSPISMLGHHTVWAASIGVDVDINATDVYGVLVSNDGLTNPFTTTSDITVELTARADL